MPPTSLSSPSDDTKPSERPPSPTAPPISPITPVMTLSLPATTNTTSNTEQRQQQQHLPSNSRPYAQPLTQPAHPPSSPDPLHTSSPHLYPPRAPNQTPRGQPQPPTPHLLQRPPRPQDQYPKSEHTAQLPPSEPFSESTNPDAIALRAAMSILQIQRRQALRDMVALEQQKEAAMQDPEGFSRAVKDGRVKSRRVEGVGPYDGEDKDEDEEDEGKENHHNRGDGDVHMEGDGMDGDVSLDDSLKSAEAVMDDRSSGNPSTSTPPKRTNQTSELESLGPLPSSQNVVRMPPINWSKYHIVGESLDRLHEQQQQRPSPGQPRIDDELKPREHVIAAPFDPWKDKIGKMGKGGGGKDGAGAGAKAKVGGGRKKKG